MKARAERRELNVLPPQPDEQPGRGQRLVAWLSGWLFHVGSVQAIAEALMILIVLVLLMTLVASSIESYTIAQGRILVSTGTLFWLTLRLRMPEGNWRRQLAQEGAVAVVFLAGQAVVMVGYDLLTRLTSVGTIRDMLFNTLVIALASVALHAFLYLCFRVGARLWLLWGRLRRHSMLWQLTHAHLTVVFLASLPFIFLSLVNGIAFPLSGTSRVDGSLLYMLVYRVYNNVLPWLAIWVLALVGSVIVIFPPSAAISFLIARQTTRRLKTLTTATSALRQGDLSARVPVSGEDELATLQTNFNAMATDLEQAMRDVRTERDRVEGLLEARQELVASVSHELRTPIATLRGYLDSAQRRRESLPPDFRQDIEVMEREAKRLQRLIDDLFALSRAEVGRLSLRMEATDVASLIRRSVETVASLAWERGRVQVVCNVTGQLPPILADAERVEQVLSNLLHNAVRHTPPGGIVAVVASVEPTMVAVEVRDTGEGIPPEALPHIWERFFRAESERNDNRGSGLGLAIVKELVEAMGGSVAVTSVVGEGSSFTVRLPRTPAVPEKQRLPLPSRVEA